jgi:GntR family transcriptional regulator/MocR family aminotransferase
VEIARQARAQGIFVNALSAHALPGGAPCNGLLLGYAQVPAERMDELVRRLAGVVDVRAPYPGRPGSHQKR